MINIFLGLHKSQPPCFLDVSTAILSEMATKLSNFGKLHLRQELTKLSVNGAINLMLPGRFKKILTKKSFSSNV